MRIHNSGENRWIISHLSFNNNPKLIIPIRNVILWTKDCTDIDSYLYKLELLSVFPAQRKAEESSAILVMCNTTWRQDNLYKLL